MYRSCLNCKTIMDDTDKYCPHCGQKDQNMISSMKDLISDAIGDIFNLDSRFFRTIGKLFIPGALTLAYFEGRRQAYFPPFRILLVSLLIALGFINFIYKDSVNKGFSTSNPFQDRKTHHLLAIDSLNRQYEQEKEKILAAYPGVDSATLEGIKDSILKGSGDSSVLDLNMVILPGYEVNLGSKTDTTPNNIDLETLIYTPLDSIANDPEETWGQRTLQRQVVKMLRSPGDYASSILSNLAWMIILMLPFIAFSLLVLYWRKGYYYVQHFVFLLHVTSFQVIAFTLGLAFSLFTSVIAIPISLIIALLYHWLAFRKVYPDRFFKSMVKYFFFSGWESIVALLAILVYILVTMAIF